MIRRKPIPMMVVAFLFALLVVLGCGRLNPGTSDSKSAADALKASPKESIAYQFDLLKKGDVDGLKRCFTARLQDRITAEAVETGRAQADKYTLDDLVASVEMGEDEGQKTAKIMMANGRTLTTLIQVNDEWLADTVWFR